MKKLYKNNLIIFIISLLLCQAFAVFSEDAESEDSTFTNSKNFLIAAGLAEKDDFTDSDKKITRAEWSSKLTRMCGLKSLYDTSGDILGEQDKYTGFGREEAVKDDWYWEGDEGSDGKINYLTATPYYDVSQEHPYWEDIKAVSVIGIMTGDENRYFRPDEYITLNESIKTAVCILGYEIYTNYNYPAGYISYANQLKLFGGMDKFQGNEFLSVRDCSVLIYNILNAKSLEVYQLGLGGVNKFQKSSEKFMSRYLGIYDVSGIVKANNLTSLTTFLENYHNSIVIEDTKYYNYSYDGEALLGCNIKAYYKLSANDDAVICYIEDIEKRNTVLTVQADDIEWFENRTLDYYTDKVKGFKKSVTLSADIDVIYNGKALNTFNDKALMPDYGKITLVDNNNDGKYDVLKVESYSIVVVSSYDHVNSVIYTGGGSIDLNNADYRILNADGNKIEDSIIDKGCVLSVKATLESQGERLYSISVSTNSVIGSVNGMTTEDDEQIITINQNDYGVIKNCTEEFRMGQYGKFRLTNDNRIVSFEYLSNSELKYAYLIAGNKGKGLDGDYYLQLYSTVGNEVVYQLADRISLNDISMKTENAYRMLAGISGTDSTTDDRSLVLQNQVIRYSLDSMGMINCLYTPDETESLKRVEVSSDKGTYRTKSKMIISEGGYKVIACLNDSTVILYVPKDDKTDIKSYGTKILANDNSISLNEAYKSATDNVTIDLAIIYEGAGADKTIDASVEPILVDRVIKSVDENGDEYYKVTGLYNGAGVEYEVTDVDLFPQISTWIRGDTVRLQTNATQKVDAVEKVYDVTKRRLVGENPTTNGSKLITQYFVLNAEARSKPQEDGYLKVAKYIYNSDGTKTASANEDDMFIYLAKTFAVQIYDTKSGAAPYAGTYKDVITAMEVGKGDELLLYTTWWDYRYFTIYK